MLNGSMRRHDNSYVNPHGFTVIEILIVIAIMGILSAIAVPVYDGYREKVKTATCILAIGVMQRAIAGYQIEAGALPADLESLGLGMDTMVDPWGNKYQYLNIGAGGPGANGKRRRDRSLNPVNTDYDLYSMGPDKKTTAQFTAKNARDDIVRANNGAFIGKASDY
jgi:general secretion pathway protein G